MKHELFSVLTDDCTFICRAVIALFPYGLDGHIFISRKGFFDCLFRICAVLPKDVADYCRCAYEESEHERNNVFCLNLQLLRLEMSIAKAVQGTAQRTEPEDKNNAFNGEHRRILRNPCNGDEFICAEVIDLVIPGHYYRVDDKIADDYDCEP